jgi:hypothetical protein
MPTLEEMRAEINRLLPEFETPQFVKNIQTAYQNMPGAAIPQAALSLGSSMIGAPLGAAYGVGKTLLSGKYGTQEGIKLGQQEANKVMNAMRYTPPTKAGRNISETIERLPQTLTGSEMGIGMLPEIWGMPPRISPSDVQVMGARGINAAREIADIPRDFSAAQSGLTRIGAFDKPTYGARLQNVAEDIGDVMARRQARRSDEGTPTLSGLQTFESMMPDTNLYAIKPKGGNWPTTLGSIAPLSEQRMIGKRLSKAQINLTDENPISFIFDDELTRYDAQNNTRLRRELVKNYLDNPDKGQDQIEQIKSFIYDKNLDLKEQGRPLLPTLDRIEKAIPSFNQWVMGPYQKYMQNQMGTGISTDPLLVLINQAEIPLHSLFPTAREGDSLDPDIVEKKRKNALERFKLNDVDVTQPTYQNIGKVTATTPIGREYEDYLDMEIALSAPMMLDKAKFPFAEKLDPYSIVYDINYSRSEGKTGFDDIQNYVLQGLMSGKYDINKVSNLPPHVVVQDMIKDYQNQLKEEQKNKELIETYRHERAKQLQVDTEFPDGSRMVVFNKASYDADPIMLKRDFGQITKDLNQCIGAGCHGTPEYPGHGPALEPHTGRPPRGSTGELSYGSYYDMVKEGRGEIVSFLDPDDKYQFTIQLRYERKPLTKEEEKTIVESWLTQNAPEDLPKYFDYVNDHKSSYGVNYMVNKHPQLRDAIIASQFTKKNVEQMRGADNGNAPEMYEQQIIDWLNYNSDQLGYISDLEQIPNVIDLGRTPANITDRLSEYEPDWDLETLRDFVETIKQEKALPRFFDGGDVSYLAEQKGINLSEPPLKELSEFDQKIVLEQFDNHILGRPDSLYDQDNLQDKFMNDINLLRGYPIKYDLPVDIHRKLVKMILSKDQSLINSVADQIRDYTITSAVAGGLEVPIPFGLTSSQATDVFNVLNGWYNRHPRKNDANIWAGYEKDSEQHPNPFDEVKLKEFVARPSNVDLIQRDLRLWIEDNMRPSMYDVPQVNEDILILMGSADPLAKIPSNLHTKLVKALLNQDEPNIARQIKNSLERLRNGEQPGNLTKAQSDNILEMLSTWTERYPFNEEE